MSTDNPPSSQRTRNSSSIGCFGAAVVLGFGMFVLGVGLFVLGAGWIFSSIHLMDFRWEAPEGPRLEEYSLRGDAKRDDVQTTDRVAVIHVGTVMVEGLIDDAIDQLELAVSDPRVKAVVVRIDSPGGTLTASEDLHRRLMEIKNAKGRGEAQTPRVLIASIGPIAASGGYYIAAPSHTIFAENSSQTGSIGVFVSFPTVEGLAKQYGFGMNLVKQGEIKDSGSPFRAMTPKEKQVWQDLVDDGYRQFLTVVEEGRPQLKGKLLEPIKIKALRAGPTGADGPPEYSRYRADGGLWTAKQAKEVGLIDKLGSLDDAIDEAIQKAGLPKDTLVVEYDRPAGFLDSILGRERHRHDNFLDIPGFDKALSFVSTGPRAWCLASGYEMEGLVALAQKGGQRRKLPGAVPLSRSAIQKGR